MEAQHNHLSSMNTMHNANDANDANQHKIRFDRVS